MVPGLKPLDSELSQQTSSQATSCVFCVVLLLGVDQYTFKKSKT
jgi:hypothetical protein